jgi:hypothetical protein
LTGNDKNAYNPPMKAYRFKCWAFNVYFEHIVNAENDEDAQRLMAEELDEKKVKLTTGGDFRDPKKSFLTFEEIKNESNTNDNKEVGVRVEVGGTSVKAG